MKRFRTPHGHIKFPMTPTQAVSSNRPTVKSPLKYKPPSTLDISGLAVGDVLVGVKSCQLDQDRGCHKAIRETWGKDLPSFCDLKFFTGAIQPWECSTVVDLLDEISLNCRDDYESLPSKTKAILTWALSRPYKFIFLCDTDTFIIPRRLFSCGFEKYDYTGVFKRPIGVEFDMVDDRGIAQKNSLPWASGGLGYFLSREAAEIVIGSNFVHWAEDFNVGQCLSRAYDRVSIYEPPRMQQWMTWHYCATGHKRKFNPAWLYRAYELGEPDYKHRWDL